MGKNDKENRRNTSMSDTLDYVLSEWRKSLYTAIPGIIQSYDAGTKRATVQPAIRTELRDGGSVDMPVLPNVPVLFPSGGGWCLAVEELSKGEAVLLVFCQRGIGAFKETFGVELPSGGIMQMDAAVAIAGFGAKTITAPSGISLQNDDGSIKVQVSDDGCEIAVGVLGGATLNPDGSVDFVNGAQVTVGGDFVTASGVSLDTHVHSGGTLAGGLTGVPQ